MAEEALKVVIEDDEDTIHVDADTGTIVEDQPDGGVVVHLDAYRPKKDKDEKKWFANLADEIGGVELGVIANDLFSAIEADDRSRGEYLETRARGLDMLGIKLEKPTGGVDEAGIEGMSKVTNPLMLEAILKGWANAQAELLPASGPCKIKDDGTETKSDDELAEAFEKGMNHYLTVTAPEYYPDTSHMLLWGTYYGGSGFKKVYRCPMRRRPVSEQIDAKDLIVSDTMKDLASCARITHQIPMRPSVMKRMKLLGCYRETSLTQPTPMPNVVDEKIAGIQGTTSHPSRPEDQPYTIWETQCELDLNQFAPGKFKGEGIPLPYLVTMDKDSREILAITRDWEEDDEDCKRIQMYVKYPYVPGPGFYGTGMLGILGNSTAAMTAAWREALDAGMYANFPAGLIAKLGARQNKINLRLAPGEFEPVETNGMDIRAIATGLPFKDVTPGLLALIDKITEQAKGVGSAPDIPAGEGLQNVPVGTMLAQIEQATKIMSAAHKGMHTAQSEELRLFVRLFRQHPEDFWVNNKEAPKDYWDEERLIQALDECDLVPVSDPNIPSHVHRVAKALALVQLSAMPQFASRLDTDEVLRRVLAAMREDPVGLVVQAPPQQIAPEDQAKMLTAQAKMADVNAKIGKLQNEQQQGTVENALKMRELASNEKIADADITKELIIHASDERKLDQAAHRDNVTLITKLSNDQQELDMARAKQGMEMVKTGVAAQHTDREHERADKEHGLDVAEFLHNAQLDRHEAGLAASQHEHDTGMERAKHGLAERAQDHEERVSAQDAQREDYHAEEDRRLQRESLKAKAKEKKEKPADRVVRRMREAGGRVVLIDSLSPPPPAPPDANEMLRDLTVALSDLGRGLQRPASPEVRELQAAVDLSPLASALEKLGQNLVNQQQSFERMIKVQTAPRRLVKGADGRFERVVTELPDETPPPPDLNVVIEKG